MIQTSLLPDVGGAVLKRGAIFSTDRRHRYLLTREWDASRPRALIVGLNPSDAGETKDDLTSVKLVEFARRWHCGSYALANISPLISTDPEGLRTATWEDLVGGDGGALADRVLAEAATGCSLFVVAWGTNAAHARLGQLAEHVLGLLRGRELWCLGLAQQRYPRHPSRLGYDRPLVRFEPLRAGGAR